MLINTPNIYYFRVFVSEKSHRQDLLDPLTQGYPQVYKKYIAWSITITKLKEPLPSYSPGCCQD